MSIDFETIAASSSIQRSAFMHPMPSFFGGFQGDRCFPPPQDDDDDDDSSSSSSIGRNSDLSSDGEDSGHDCEDSQVRRGPFDTMADLEEVLPMQRGISKFYTGKSKSFTSLADASSASSVKDLAKPENPFTRKRKNLLARGNLLGDQNCTFPSNENTSCTSKKPSPLNSINCPRSSNAREESQSRSSSPSSSSRPPLHPCPKPSLGYKSCSSPPRRNSPWRSFSLLDLQSAAGNCND